MPGSIDLFFFKNLSVKNQPSSLYSLSIMLKRSFIVKTSLRKSKIRDNQQEYRWCIDILFLDPQGEQHQTRPYIKSLELSLHPDFQPSERTIKSPGPYRIIERGWGGFDIPILINVWLLLYT
jgi:transcription initiation factor IIF auxiliary subunit